MAKRDNRQTIDGIASKRCPHCLEWWPETTEFFSCLSRKQPHRLASWCRACVCEWKATRRKELLQGASCDSR